MIKADSNPEDLLQIATYISKYSLVAFPDTIRNHMHICNSFYSKAKVVGAPKEDVIRLSEKLKTLKKHGDNKPWLHIYDGIRFSIIIDDLDNLRYLVEDILRYCEGMVINLKPKLDTSL